MEDEAHAPDQEGPVVVAGVGPVARLVAAAALLAGHEVVGLAERPDELRDLIVDDPELVAGLDAGHYRITDDPAACAGFSVALVTEPPESDALVSPIEHYTAELAPHLQPGCLLVLSSSTADHSGLVADATVELLTGLRAGSDYALGHLFPPASRGWMIVSGIDNASADRTQHWLVEFGFTAIPVMPVAAAEIVATLLARDDQPPEGAGPGPH